MLTWIRKSTANRYKGENVWMKGARGEMQERVIGVVVWDVKSVVAIVKRPTRRAKKASSCVCRTNKTTCTRCRCENGRADTDTVSHVRPLLPFSSNVVAGQTKSAR